MAVELRMPKLGLTMQEATITEWLVADGDEVAAGAAILTIETDKVETDVDSPESGIVRIHGEVGQVYECGTVIGWFVEEGEPTPEPPAEASPAVSAGPAVAAVPVAASRGGTPVRADGGRILASPYARTRATELRVDLARVGGTGPGGRIVSEDVEAAAAAGTAGPSRTDRVVPHAARSLARELGIDVDTIPSSSPDGRLSREDVFAHARHLIAGGGATTAPVAPVVPFSPQTPTERVPFTGMRGTIAERMAASLDTMAQLTLDMSADLDAVVALREELADEMPADARPGYTDFVIAAAARALRQHPVVNSQVRDDHLELLPDVHVGMAVAVEDGLIVPVIEHADTLPVTDLSVETSRLATAARDRTLSLDELSGGTFSVTALGMFGVDSFTPVINPVSYTHLRAHET